MTVKIYGNMQSSAFRCVWAAEELKLDYELLHIESDACSTSNVLYALNPNRKIPVMDDNGFVLWESMAINHYLSRKDSGSMAPNDPAEDARMQMWSFWVANECLTNCFAVLDHTVLRPTAERSERILQSSIKQLYHPLGVLEQHLQANSFLVGDRFTIADLNVASVLGWLTAAQFDFSKHPCLSNWLHQISIRPAAKKSTAMAALELGT